MTTDAAGNQTSQRTYFAYGNTRTATGVDQTDQLYTGQRLDASTGLYFYQSRYYDPVLARFVQPDSIVPSIANPQTLNRYWYGNNNPTKYLDRDGHFAFMPLLIVAAFAAYDAYQAYQTFQDPSSTDLDKGIAVASVAFDVIPGGGKVVGLGVKAVAKEVGKELVKEGVEQGAKKAAVESAEQVVKETVEAGAREGAGSVARSTVQTAKHHTVPKQILKDELPPEVAKAVRGKRGSPNRWRLRKDLHDDIHRGPGGGVYNDRFIEELDKIRNRGLEVTADDVYSIRDRLAVEFGIDQYRPGGG